MAKIWSLGFLTCFEAHFMGTSEGLRRIPEGYPTPDKKVRETGCFGLVLPAAIFALPKVPAGLPGQRVSADVLLTDEATGAIEAVEAIAGAKGSVKVIGGPGKLTAAFAAAVT
jgi:hypothetical protein